MKPLAFLLAFLMSGCAQVSLTVYNDSSGLEYTTIKMKEGTRIVVTKNTIEVNKEEVK